MLSILSDGAFSRTKCAGPTIAPTGTICILSVCLTTQMNPSTQLAQPWGLLYFVGITTAYSWASGSNIHSSVFLHLREKVAIVFPAGRRSLNRMIEFGGVQLMYNTGKEGTSPWKVYRGHFPYIGPRFYKIQAWSLGWHWYILPCNQVPDSQQI